MKNLNKFLKEKNVTYKCLPLLFENSFSYEIENKELESRFLHDENYVEYYRERDYLLIAEILISKIYKE